MATNPGDGDDEGEWRFSLEDIEKREQSPAEEADEGDGDETGGNVAGSFRPTGEMEAGDIDLENALFVLVGVALAVLVLAGFMTILP